MSYAYKNGLQYLGNVIKNIYDGKEDAFKTDPDIESKGKITKLLSKFIITPNVVVDEKLKFMDETIFKDLVKTEMNTFTALVTNAIRVMVEQYGTEPIVAIDKLGNSDVREDISRIRDLVAGANSTNYDYIADLFSDESVLGATAGLYDKDVKNMTKPSTIDNNNMIQKDVASFINSYEIQLQFETSRGNIRAITIPIIIYPNIVFENSDALINDRFGKELSVTVMDAFNDYSAGLQSFMDIILATNIVKEYRDRKLNSKSFFSKYLNSVDKTSFIKDILHNKNNFAKNFNIYIFDSSMEYKLNKLLKGSILKSKYKQKAMSSLMAFSISFVSIEEEEVTYLLDEIEGFSILKFNMLKKEKDSDIAKVVKEMLNNKPPF